MSETIEHKNIAPGINTMTFSELRDTFFKTVKECNGDVLDGFRTEEQGCWFR